MIWLQADTWMELQALWDRAFPNMSNFLKLTEILRHDLIRYFASFPRNAKKWDNSFMMNVKNHSHKWGVSFTPLTFTAHFTSFRPLLSTFLKNPLFFPETLDLAEPVFCKWRMWHLIDSLCAVRESNVFFFFYGNTSWNKVNNPHSLCSKIQVWLTSNPDFIFSI